MQYFNFTQKTIYKMKNLLLCAFFLLSVTGIFGQNIYWNCYSIKVDDSEGLVAAMDQFMATEKGKSMPFTSLSQFVNRSTTLQASHQLCFLSDDPADFDNMQQKFTNAEAQVLGMVWDEEVDIVASVLGQPLIFDPTKVGGVYSNIYSLKVTDAPAFATAFKTLTEAFPNMTIELHEAIAGAEDHVTHYAVSRADGLANWIKNRNAIGPSKAWADFVSQVKGKSETISSFSVRLLKSYNAPE